MVEVSNLAPSLVDTAAVRSFIADIRCICEITRQVNSYNADKATIGMNGLYVGSQPKTDVMYLHPSEIGNAACL